MLLMLLGSGRHQTDCRIGRPTAVASPLFIVVNTVADGGVNAAERCPAARDCRPSSSRAIKFGVRLDVKSGVVSKPTLSGVGFPIQLSLPLDMAA